MMDEKGRIWLTSQIRSPANPDWCKAGSTQPSAKAFPIKESNRNIAMYDPAAAKFTLLSTCFPTHHLAFSRDHDMLFFSGGVAHGLRQPVRPGDLGLRRGPDDQCLRHEPLQRNGLRRRRLRQSIRFSLNY